MAIHFECRNMPGMDGCPAKFTAETVDELLEHVQVHGRRAHGMDMSTLPDDVREKILRVFEYDESK